MSKNPNQAVHGSVANAAKPPRAKRKSTVDPNETKSAKFVRLANARITKLMKAYKQIGQLGNPAYESTPDQRKKIEAAIAETHRRAMDGLNAVKVATIEFKL